MSAHVSVRLTCDWPGCVAYRECREEVASADRQRVQALNSGWSMHDGYDFCRAHNRPTPTDPKEDD